MEWSNSSLEASSSSHTRYDSFVLLSISSLFPPHFMFSVVDSSPLALALPFYPLQGTEVDVSQPFQVFDVMETLEAKLGRKLPDPNLNGMSRMLSPPHSCCHHFKVSPPISSTLCTSQILFQSTFLSAKNSA